MTAGRQIANLQGARAGAALLVLFYHVQPMLNRVYGLSLHSHFGVIGVDIFFVLSGFVMFYSNPEPAPPAAGRFLVQRFIRIVPLYWLATLAIVAFFIAGFKPVGLHELSPRIVAESLVFIPSSFPQGRHDLILTVGWTLMFELFFYLAFALTFALRSLEKSLAALTILFGALCIWGQLDRDLSYLLTFYTSPIMIEFLFGAALAVIYLRWSAPIRRGLPRCGLALLSLGLAIAIGQDIAGVSLPNKHDARFLLLGLPALLIIAGALAMERGGWVLRQRALLELGAASYALYLFHPIILQIVVKTVGQSGRAGPVAAGAAAIAACMVAAIVIHRTIERPILASTKRRLAPRAATPVPLPSTTLQAVR